MTDKPKSWRCAACWATEGFLATPDRVIHVGTGHCGRVVEVDGTGVQYEVGP